MLKTKRKSITNFKPGKRTYLSIAAIIIAAIFVWSFQFALEAERAANSGNTETEEQSGGDAASTDKGTGLL
jgi:hypothetical protein